jgi:hypothetical protein
MTPIKLAYPKIPDSKNCPFKQCIVFEKYDGTNLHWVWDSELSWYAFGTRRDRFDLDEMGIRNFNAAHPGLEEAPSIFMRDFANALATIFHNNPDYHCPEIVVFTEFFGASSFAGMHKKEDTKQLVLFDVQTDKGIIEPEKFVKDFKELNIAKVVYRGKLTGKFIDNVREGKFNVAEGVICKGGKSSEDFWMVQIQTNASLKKLPKIFPDDLKNSLE